MSKITQSLYSFSVQDKDAEALTFGWVAASPDEAKSAALRAGHREVLLLEVRPLKGVEIPQVGRQKAASNPLVGKDWLPLVELMARNLHLKKVGDAWILDVFSHDEPLAKGSPYAQGILEPDGSVHVEVGPTQSLRSFAPDNEDLAVFLGWERPLDTGLPNFFRTFSPGTSVEYVGATVIQALTSLFGFSTKDGFSLHHRLSQIHVVDGVEPLDPGPDIVMTRPAFGLTGLHRVSFALGGVECAVSSSIVRPTLPKARDEV